MSARGELYDGHIAPLRGRLENTEADLYEAVCYQVVSGWPWVNGCATAAFPNEKLRMSRFVEKVVLKKGDRSARLALESAFRRDIWCIRKSRGQTSCLMSRPFLIGSRCRAQTQYRSEGRMDAFELCYNDASELSGVVVAERAPETTRLILLPAVRAL